MYILVHDKRILRENTFSNASFSLVRRTMKYLVLTRRRKNEKNHMLLLYCRITADFSFIQAAKAGTSNCRHESKV